MSSRLERALGAAGSLAALGGLVWLAVTLAGRVAFPWPLEWMEGSVLHHGLRLLSAEPVFAAPSARFVPYLYPPLGYLPFGLVGLGFGASLPAARGVSLLALAATLALLGRAAARASGARAGLLAAGLYAWGFALSGAFYDLVRVDAIFLLLLAAGAERLAAGRVGACLVWLALSVFAKQHGLLFLGAASAWALWDAPRRHAPKVAGTWLGLAGALALAHFVSGGWFSTYVWVLARAQPVDWGRAADYLLRDLPGSLPLLLVAAAAGLWQRRRAPQGVDALLLAGLAAGALGFAHQGGYDNARMPALALLALVSAPVLDTWLRRGSLAGRGATAAALAAQVALLCWWPPSLWPAPDAGRRFSALADALEECAGGGPAVALDHALLTGVPFLHAMELNDLLIARKSPLGAQALRELERELASPDAPAAIAVGAPLVEVQRALERHYHPCRQLPAPPFASGFQPPDTTVWARSR